MAVRALMVCLAALIAAALLYASPYWPVQLWGRPGLFGLSSLPPGGDLVGRWLRGTPLAPFDLMVWAVGSFALLSTLQWAASKLGKGG
ncbi:MAG: hypothetical protein AAGM84_07705 [Pseudomonadota bacterium]